MSLLISVSVFAIVTGTLVSVYFLSIAESPIRKRMRAVAPEAATSRQRQGVTRRLVHRLLAAVGQYSVTRPDRSLSQTLSSAGIRVRNAALLFLGARALLSFGPALLIVMRRVSAGEPLTSTLWIGAGVWAVGHFGLNIWLRRRSRQRIQLLNETLPDALDLMVVCLESGLGLNATIARVGEERASMNDALGHEFAQVSFELRSGRSREEALRGLGDRNGTVDLKTLAGLIIQSDRLGASMGKTLRAHADLLRTRRRQRAEEAARKLPIKVLFPLATLLLPPLFIMVVGPAFLKFRDLITAIVER